MFLITRMAVQAVANGNGGKFLELLSTAVRDSAARKSFTHRSLSHKSSPFQLSYKINLHNKQATNLGK